MGELEKIIVYTFIGRKYTLLPLRNIYFWQVRVYVSLCFENQLVILLDQPRSPAFSTGLGLRFLPAGARRRQR